MDKVVRPVLSYLASDKLKKEIPVTLSFTIDNTEQRKNVYTNWILFTGMVEAFF